LITVVGYTSEPGIWFLEIVIINPKNHLDVQWGFGVVFHNRPTMNYTLNLSRKEGWFARIIAIPHTICLDRSPKCFPLAYGKVGPLSLFSSVLAQYCGGSTKPLFKCACPMLGWVHLHPPTIE
jgi:hypothetical protein